MTQLLLDKKRQVTITIVLVVAGVYKLPGFKPSLTFSVFYNYKLEYKIFGHFVLKIKYLENLVNCESCFKSHGRCCRNKSLRRYKSTL